MNSNIFYFHTLNSIGGIESFFYQLGKKYGKDFDITVYYHSADLAQVERLSQFVKVRKVRDGQTIRCKRAFLCFNLDIIDQVEAEEYYQMLHGDYVQIGVFPDKNPKIKKWVAVSEVVRDSYKNYTGADSVVSYNPYTPEKTRKVLRLISATRLTAEKGYNRMVALAQELDKAGIPFQWDIYTDSIKKFDNPSVVFRKPRLDIIDFIADADYLVQLSDTEGFCYSIVEALSVGTPVIVTDFKVAHEIGVVDRVNGFVLPMSMQCLPIKEIYKGLKKFKYTPPEDKWGELLVPGKNNEELDIHVRVRCKKIYYDIEWERNMEFGEEWEVPLPRADKLLDLGLVELVTKNGDKRSAV